MKRLSPDFVDLSIGKVLFRELRNGDVNYAMSKATVVGSTLNNNYFFQLLEYRLLKLSKWRINRLSVKDGEAVRRKLKDILARHNLLEINNPEEDNEKEEFTELEKSWFEAERRAATNKLGGLIGKS